MALATAGHLSGLKLHNNAWNGVRLIGEMTTDVSLVPMVGSYYYARNDTLWIRGGSRENEPAPVQSSKLESEWRL